MTIKGKDLSLDQWAARTGINRSTIANRMARGWTAAEAVEIDPRPRLATGPPRKLAKTRRLICPHCLEAFEKAA